MSSSHEVLDIVDILRLSPDSQKPDLRSNVIRKEAFNQLSKRLVDKKNGMVRFILCPRLESIVLFEECWEQIDFMDFEEGGCKCRPIVKMASRRWNVPATQRALRAVAIGWVDTYDVPELNVLRSEGLDVK